MGDFRILDQVGVVYLSVLIKFDDLRLPLADIAATLRWDMQDKSQPAQMTLGDPDDPASEWVEAALLEDIIPHDRWQSLMRRIDRSPQDYCADPTEGERLQQIVYAHLGVGRAA